MSETYDLANVCEKVAQRQGVKMEFVMPSTLPNDALIPFASYGQPSMVLVGRKNGLLLAYLRFDSGKEAIVVEDKNYAIQVKRSDGSGLIHIEDKKMAERVKRLREKDPSGLAFDQPMKGEVSIRANGTGFRHVEGFLDDILS